VEVRVAEKFGRYELHELLGRGGMGEVFRATDTIRDRTVALKLLPKHLAEDESFKARFRREARLAARLNEPHIVPIHDFGEIDGRLFLDMRLVEGRDLGSLLAEHGALPIDTAVDIISQVAAALDAAHASGLVHRDVKPSNVLLTGIADGDLSHPFAYLVDFGIARSSADEGTSLTATSATVGTIAYMSPERIRGERGDRRTDIYAMACVLYEALTGRKAFDGEVVAIMYAHLHTTPPAVSALTPDSPSELDAVLRKGMAKEPEDRYSTAGSLAAAARAALRAAGTQSITSPPTDRPSPATTLTPTSPPYPSSPPQHYTPPPPPPPQHYTPPPPPPPPHYTPPPQQYTPPPRYTPAPQQTPAQQHAPAPQHYTPPPPGPRSQPNWPSKPIGSRPTGRRRTVWIVGAVAVLVAAVVTVVVITLSGGSPTAGPSPGPSTAPVTTHASSSSTATLDPGPTGNVVTWQNFTSFATLLGTRNGDTAHALRGASCQVEGPETNDIAGIVDQVKCTYGSSPVVSYVARFDSADSVQGYLHRLLDAQYQARTWSIGGVPRGVTYSSASSAVDITSTICGLPTFLVQFYAAKDTGATLSSVTNYWDAAAFPDLVPPECSPDFRSTLPGATASPGARSYKVATVFTREQLASFLERGDSTRTAVLVTTPTGYETMVVGQTGKVSFWRYRSSDVSVTKIGISSYPYDPKSLGPPYAVGRGTVLNNMVHATFIVTGVFSTDGSGNAVAYTTGARGWGAIKAVQNGNLAPSGAGVGLRGIGLSQAFEFVLGQLETADCSTAIPISQCGGNNRVLKIWAWTGAEFVRDRTP
jgi:serine/threonine protein kinase